MNNAPNSQQVTCACGAVSVPVRHAGGPHDRLSLNGIHTFLECKPYLNRLAEDIAKKMDVPVHVAEGALMRAAASEMRLSHQTAADPTLPHQVVFITVGGGNGNPVHVTCNCRVRAGRGDMGITVDLNQSRTRYNDPDNHVEPFDPTKDAAKW